MKKGRVLLEFIFIVLFSSCGITTYSKFEFTQKDDDYNDVNLFSDSLINISFWKQISSLGSFDCLIKVKMNSNEKLMIDSLGFDYKYSLKNGTVISDTGVKVVSTYDSNNKFFHFSSFKDFPDDLRTYNKKGQTQIYAFDNYSSIPKDVKKLQLNIFIKYRVGQSQFFRKFPVELKSRLHRYLYFGRDD